MNELRHESRGLFKRARQGFEPSDRDRARVTGALARKLGIAAGTLASAATSASASVASAGTAAGAMNATLGAGAGVGAGASTLLGVAKWAGAVFLVGAVGAGSVSIYRTRSKASAPQESLGQVHPSTEGRTVASASNASAMKAPALIAEAPLSPPQAESPSVTPGAAIEPPTAVVDAPRPSVASATRGVSSGEDTRGSSARVPSNGSSAVELAKTPAVEPLPPSSAPSGPASTSLVAEETRILGAANEALRAGGANDATRALALLDEHARAFPNGVFAEERSALRVSALCKLGRVREAGEEAGRFLRANADSPLAASVRSSCGAPDRLDSR
jgi:hypothetical protein